MRTPDSPTLSRYSMAELKRSVDIAYRKWCKRRGLDPQDQKLSFNDRADCEVREASGRKRRAVKEAADAAREMAGGGDASDAASLSTTVAALDACPETLPESLLRGRGRQP